VCSAALGASALTEGGKARALVSFLFVFFIFFLLFLLSTVEFKIQNSDYLYNGKILDSLSSAAELDQLLLKCISITKYKLHF